MQSMASRRAKFTTMRGFSGSSRRAVIKSSAARVMSPMTLCANPRRKYARALRGWTLITCVNSAMASASWPPRSCSAFARSCAYSVRSGRRRFASANARAASS
eukprot:Amastigsp_a518780_4.p3 type:complete len:103 gc:universal Amastigsp_a518780_4:3-311(+)